MSLTALPALVADDVAASIAREFAWVHEHTPRVLPAGWRVVERRHDGTMFLRSDRLKVICAGMVELDGKRWLHVSCSRPARLPSWDDLRVVKDLFVGRDRTALQVLPPTAKHVNLMPYCLHLWCCLDGDVTPDFTHGSGLL